MSLSGNKRDLHPEVDDGTASPSSSTKSARRFRRDSNTSHLSSSSSGSGYTTPPEDEGCSSRGSVSHPSEQPSAHHLLSPVALPMPAPMLPPPPPLPMHQQHQSGKVIALKKRSTYRPPQLPAAPSSGLGAVLDAAATIAAMATRGAPQMQHLPAQPPAGRHYEGHGNGQTGLGLVMGLSALAAAGGPAHVDTRLLSYLQQTRKSAQGGERGDTPGPPSLAVPLPAPGGPPPPCASCQRLHPTHISCPLSGSTSPVSCMSVDRCARLAWMRRRSVTSRHTSTPLPSPLLLWTTTCAHPSH